MREAGGDVQEPTGRGKGKLSAVESRAQTVTIRLPSSHGKERNHHPGVDSSRVEEARFLSAE